MEIQDSKNTTFNVGNNILIDTSVSYLVKRAKMQLQIKNDEF